MILSVFKI